MLCALLGHNKHCKYLNILGLTKTVAMCNKLQIDIGSLYETMLGIQCLSGNSLLMKLRISSNFI